MLMNGSIVTVPGIGTGVLWGPGTEDGPEWTLEVCTDVKDEASAGRERARARGTGKQPPRTRAIKKQIGLDLRDTAVRDSVQVHGHPTETGWQWIDARCARSESS